MEVKIQGNVRGMDCVGDVAGIRDESSKTAKTANQRLYLEHCHTSIHTTHMHAHMQRYKGYFGACDADTIHRREVRSFLSVRKIAQGGRVHCLTGLNFSSVRQKNCCMTIKECQNTRTDSP